MLSDDTTCRGRCDIPQGRRARRNRRSCAAAVLRLGISHLHSILVGGERRRQASPQCHRAEQDTSPAEDAFAALATGHDLVLAHSTSGAPLTGTDDLVVPLGREPLDVTLPPTHPLARERKVRPDQVVELGWIGVPEGYPFDALLRSVGQAAGVMPRAVPRVQDNRLMRSRRCSGCWRGRCRGISDAAEEQRREQGVLLQRARSGHPR